MNPSQGSTSPTATSGGSRGTRPAARSAGAGKTVAAVATTAAVSRTASQEAIRSMRPYWPRNTTAAVPRTTAAVHSAGGPGATRMTAVAAAPARPATVATATATWGRTMAHTAQFRGPGTRAKPSTMVSPVQTV